MLDATDTEYAPWYIVRSDDKRRARLNCDAYLLSQFPHDPVPHPRVRMAERSKKGVYDDAARRADIAQLWAEQPRKWPAAPTLPDSHLPCHTRVHLTAEKPVCYPVLERFIRPYIHETALQQGRPQLISRGTEKISIYGGFGLGVLGYSSNNAAIVFGAFAWWVICQTIAHLRP